MSNRIASPETRQHGSRMTWGVRCLYVGYTGPHTMNKSSKPSQCFTAHLYPYFVPIRAGQSGWRGVLSTRACTKYKKPTGLADNSTILTTTTTDYSQQHSQQCGTIPDTCAPHALEVFGRANRMDSFPSIKQACPRMGPLLIRIPPWRMFTTGLNSQTASMYSLLSSSL